MLADLILEVTCCKDTWYSTLYVSRTQVNRWARFVDIIGKQKLGIWDIRHAVFTALQCQRWNYHEFWSCSFAVLKGAVNTKIWEKVGIVWIVFDLERSFALNLLKSGLILALRYRPCDGKWTMVTVEKTKGGVGRIASCGSIFCSIVGINESIKQSINQYVKYSVWDRYIDF